MSRVSTKAVIAAIEAATGDKAVELVKGDGYFYFMHPTLTFTQSSSVMVYRLTELSVAEWVEEFKDAMQRSGHALANTQSTAQHAPGPWLVVTYCTPRGPRMRVQRQNGKAVEVRTSASGKPSTFCTYDAARRVARALNEDAANEAYLKAKYAGLPPLPPLTLRNFAKATGIAA